MQVYQNNRKKIYKELKKDSILVIFSGELKTSSADQEYPFVINKNFYYLTGIERSDFILVMHKTKKQCKTHLFIEKPNYDIEKWVGYKMTKDEAKEISAVDEVHYLEDFDTFIAQLSSINRASAGDLKYVYTDSNRLVYDRSFEVGERWLADFMKKYPHVKVKNALKALIKARMIKEDYEIEELRKAISYTNDGLQLIMKNLKAGKYEYQMDSLFKHSITYAGSLGNSFDTIAASGKNAVILHYVENRAKLEDGNLILMDLGALSNNYCADISRTFPISGKYSDRQRQLMEIVLGAQAKVKSIIKPGLPFDELNKTCREYYCVELKKIGLIEKDEDLDKYYYHGVSHHLGLDVHDISDRNEPLKAGMVITVEPGLYIAEEGIGIRIEDDVLVTENGYETLSEEILRTPDEIEAFMKENAIV